MQPEPSVEPGDETMTTRESVMFMSSKVIAENSKEHTCNRLLASKEIIN